MRSVGYNGVMSWRIDHGPDGYLEWTGTATATARVLMFLDEALAETPDWVEVGIGGSYPRFTYTDDPEAYLYAWALARYPRSPLATGPEITGDFEAVRNRVIPPTPKGAVR